MSPDRNVRNILYKRLIPEDAAGNTTYNIVRNILYKRLIHVYHCFGVFVSWVSEIYSIRD